MVTFSILCWLVRWKKYMLFRQPIINSFVNSIKVALFKSPYVNIWALNVDVSNYLQNPCDFFQGAFLSVYHWDNFWRHFNWLSRQSSWIWKNGVRTELLTAVQWSKAMKIKVIICPSKLLHIQDLYK